MTPTERGRSLLDAVEPMLRAAEAARSALERGAEVSGEVTLTTVGEVLRWVLTGCLPDLYRAHPRIRLRILVSNEVHSLAANAERRGWDGRRARALAYGVARGAARETSRGARGCGGGMAGTEPHAFAVGAGARHRGWSSRGGVTRVR